MIRIEERFRNSKYPETVRGFATILESGPLTREIDGSRVLFSIRESPEISEIEPRGIYATRGVITLRHLSGSSDFDRFALRNGALFQFEQARLLRVVRPVTDRYATHWASILTRAPPEDQSEAGALAAMILGDRDLLTDSQKSSYLRTGTMHLFAVSGLHIAAFGAALFYGLLILPVRASIRQVIAMLILGYYVWTIGMPASAVRAFLMIAFFWFGKVVLRKPNPVAATINSAFCILLVEPQQLFSLGFQLSYSVVLSILLLGVPLAQELHARIRLFPFLIPQDVRWHHRLRQEVVRRGLQALCISFSATIASMPLILDRFGVYTPGAILLNVALIPLAGLVVINGVLVLATGLAGLTPVSSFLAYGAWLTIAVMEWLIDQSAQLPGIWLQRSWNTTWPAELLTAGYVFALILFSGRRLGSSRLSALGIPAIGLLAITCLCSSG